MKQILIRSTIALIAGFPISASATVTNVALGRPVTPAGSFGSAPSQFATLTDGLFLGRSTQWQSGTVWWYGSVSTLTIDLGGTFDLVAAIVQADDNDAYALDYRDPTDGSWKRLWSIPNYDYYGGVNQWGMQTRPDPVNDQTKQWFAGSVRADQIRLMSLSSDGSCSVSEVQVFADVPPPCHADVDGNRVVDTADISLLLLDFGPCASCPSDLDGSGITDTADVSLLLLDFGTCPS